MTNMPWMFYIPNPKTAELIAAHLYELGGVVIADPAHLPSAMRESYLHTIGDVDEEGQLPILIHAVDWTAPVEWNPDEPEVMARDVYAMADAPGEFFDSLDALPEGAPARVVEWLDLADDEDESDTGNR